MTTPLSTQCIVMRDREIVCASKELKLLCGVYILSDIDVC